MSNDDDTMTDGGEPIRKALFETEDGDATYSLDDPRGHFAPTGTGTTRKEADADEDKDVEDDEEDGRDLLKKSLGTNSEEGETVNAPDREGWETGPDVLTEPASETDAVGKDVQRRVKARQGELNTRGIFETRADVLRDVRDLLRAGRGRAGVSKAVKGNEAGGDDKGELAGDLSDPFEAMLTESEAIIEDAEALVDADAEGEEWAGLKERVDGLIASMDDAPAPETPAEVAAVETLRDRAAKLADILDDEDDPNGDEADEGIEADGEERDD